MEYIISIHRIYLRISRYYILVVSSHSHRIYTETNIIYTLDQMTCH